MTAASRTFSVRVVSAWPITTINLEAAVAGSLPWTIGMPFEEGLVQPGSLRALSGATAFQAREHNYWPDGTVKFAVLSGVSALAANTPATVAIGLGGGVLSEGSVAPLTADEVGTTGVDLGTAGQASLSAAIAGDDLSAYSGGAGVRPAQAGRLRVLEGAVMREEHFYVPASADPYLATVWYVRKYVTGHVEIELVVENGWLGVEGPETRSYTAELTVNGTVRPFWDGQESKAVTHDHHTRWSRRDWVDPATSEVVARHEPGYLSTTRLVPNYGWPDATGEEAFTTENYTGTGADGRAIASITAEEAARPDPFGYGMFRIAQNAGSDGYVDQIGILPHWDAIYVRTADARALRAVELHGRVAARFGVWYRDERTLDVPRIDATTVYRWDEGQNGTTPAPTGPLWEPEKEHQALVGYLAWLVTGRYPFLETLVAMALWNFFQTPTTQPWPWTNGIGRDGIKGIVRIGSVRQIGWQLRSLAAAACAAFDGSGTQADLRAVWQENVTWLWTLQQGPAPAGGSLVNDLGMLFHQNVENFDNTVPPGTTLVDYLRVGPWQHAFLVSSIGWAWDMKISTGESTIDRHQFIRDFGYGFSMGHLGHTAEGEYSWRRADTYYEPVGYPSTAMIGAMIEAPATIFASWRAVYDEQIAYFQATDEPDADPATQKLFDGPLVDGGFAHEADYWSTSDERDACRKVCTRSHFAPLAYAADHGYPGAREKFDLLTQSYSYQTANSRASLATFPRYVVTPR